MLPFEPESRPCLQLFEQAAHDLDVQEVKEENAVGAQLSQPLQALDERVGGGIRVSEHQCVGKHGSRFSSLRASGSLATK